MIQGHCGCGRDIERFFAAKHGYFDDEIACCQDLWLDAFYFASDDKRDFLWRLKGRQGYCPLMLLEPYHSKAERTKLGQDWIDLVVLMPGNRLFGTERRLVYLSVDFAREMREARVLGCAQWVWRIPGQVYTCDAQSVGGTKQRTDIVAATQVVRYQNDFAHATIIQARQTKVNDKR